jgi:type I restriction enzyme, S subunit
MLDEKSPISWENPAIEEVCSVNPRIDKTQYADDLIITFIPMPAVEAETGKIDISEKREFGTVRKGYTPFQRGDVLFAKITPCMENGKMAVVPELPNNIGFGSTEFHVLRTFPGVLPKLVFYFVSSKFFRYDAEHNMTGAVGQRRVPTPYIEQAKIPLPPTIEQHRIVAKIEELFSEIDKGVESLETAKAQLRVYRQSLLKHAFEGKLTAQWRRDNPDQVVPAEQLLEQIKQAREERYLQQLEEWEGAVKRWKKKGEKGKKPSKPNKIQEFSALKSKEIKNHNKLPANWQYFHVGNLCEVVRGGSPRPAGNPEYYDGDIPFLKVADITGNPGPYLDSFTYTIKEAGLKKTRFVTPNILMLSNSGATLGVPKICRFPTTFNDGIAAFLGLCNSELLYHYYFWESQTLMLRSINQGAAQPNLNTNLIKEVVIPMCSVDEMQVVVNSLESILTVCDKLVTEIDINLLRASTLKQSILKKAFSGQLVPQDPTDEPTSQLLERIKAEKSPPAPLCKGGSADGSGRKRRSKKESSQK